MLVNNKFNEGMDNKLYARKKSWERLCHLADGVAGIQTLIFFAYEYMTGKSYFSFPSIFMKPRAHSAK